MNNEDLKELLNPETLNRFLSSVDKKYYSFVIKFTGINEKDIEIGPIPGIVPICGVINLLKKKRPNLGKYLWTFTYNKKNVEGLVEKVDFSQENSSKKIEENFQDHISFNKESELNTLEFEVFISRLKDFKVYIFTKENFDNKKQEKYISTAQKLCNSFIKKIAYSVVYFETKYVECNKEENDMLLIITDENFMEEICENQINKADFILILSQPTSQKAIVLQKKYGKGKIPLIKNNVELLLNFSSLKDII